MFATSFRQNGKKLEVTVKEYNRQLRKIEARKARAIAKAQEALQARLAAKGGINRV